MAVNQLSRSTEDWVVIAVRTLHSNIWNSFEKDDIALYELKREYESGRILAGEMKKLCIEKASLWLEEISEKKEMWRGRLSEFLAPDSR